MKGSAYKPTAAETACVLKGGCFITELNIFERVVTNLTDGAVMGWKYYDFGEDDSSKTMQIRLKVRGMGSKGRLHILIDSEDGEEIGVVDFGENDAVIGGRVKAVTGRHALYIRVETGYTGWFAGEMKGRQLLQLSELVFIK